MWNDFLTYIIKACIRLSDKGSAADFIADKIVALIDLLPASWVEDSFSRALIETVLDNLDNRLDKQELPEGDLK
jgi:hypothetical protein